jgi:hypothetical protein
MALQPGRSRASTTAGRRGTARTYSGRNKHFDLSAGWSNFIGRQSNIIWRGKLRERSAKPQCHGE